MDDEYSEYRFSDDSDEWEDHEDETEESRRPSPRDSIHEPMPGQHYYYAYYSEWDLPYDLENAFQERSPVSHVVDGLFPLPSLSIVYGLPGDFKSMLLMDAAICVASGRPWLPLKADPTTYLRVTKQVPTLWYDYDNGKRRCAERFEALAKSHGVKPDMNIPFYYLSMPSDALDASSRSSVERLKTTVQKLNVQFICIDNLGLILGEADENSVDMSYIMNNLRRLVEETDSACVVIHHQRKSKDGARSHAGESLRGHSSINAAIDLALQVTRKPGTNIVSIRSTKTRGKDVPTFGAEFEYTPRPDYELETAWFLGIPVAEGDKHEAAKTAVTEMLKTNGQLNQTNLTKQLQAAGFKKSLVQEILVQMMANGLIKITQGDKNAKLYSLA